MKSWELNDVAVVPHVPEILASGDDARVIVLHLPAGESLQDHEVHERARLIVIDGEVEVTSGTDQSGVVGGPGLLVEFDPGERHQVDARSAARMLLILTPWPGDGHPGALTLEEKAGVRQRAAEKAGG